MVKFHKIPPNKMFLEGCFMKFMLVKQIIEDNLLVREALSEFYEGLDELLFIGTNGCSSFLERND